MVRLHIRIMTGSSAVLSTMRAAPESICVCGVTASSCRNAETGRFRGIWRGIYGRSHRTERELATQGKWAKAAADR